MKDWRGVAVEQGDMVIYASRSGSSLNIVEGKVQKIEGDIAHVEFIADRYSHWSGRKQKVFRVSGKYLTVVWFLRPVPPSDTA